MSINGLGGAFILFGVLYLVIKHAVAAGILLADERRHRG